MKQIVQNMKNGETEIVEVPVPKVQPGFLLIKTGASLVSAGTERMLVNFAEKNLVGKAKARPDLLRQVVQKAQREGVISTLESALNRLDQPIVLGYSSSGTVVEVGDNVEEFKPGDRVACGGGGYAVHAEYSLIPKNLAAKIPDTVSFEEGAFATIGSIALNGVRLASPQVGEKSAVIGLGLLGFLSAEILKASGCEVVGIDLNPDRIEFAYKNGVSAEYTDSIEEKYLQITEGKGFDHIFICADTKSNGPVELAGLIARDRANVIAIGAVGMEIPRKAYYEKELSFKVSRSYGPGRYDKTYEEDGIDYPEGYVRWTEGRNIGAIVKLIAENSIHVSQLISHHFEIQNAVEAYQLLAGKKKEDYLGLIINYSDDQETLPLTRTIEISGNHLAFNKSALSIGVVGAGNYANAVFLPIIKKHPLSKCFSVSSVKGLTAQQAGQKFGFRKASSDEKSLLADEDVDAAVILTRHDTHSSLTVEALQKEKHVYCEKPLALNKIELEAVISQLHEDNHPYLTVGYNRRFAPLVNDLKAELSTISEPIFVHYRINAGFIPKDHWLHERETGGGRLKGEACHFIDLMLYLVGSKPVEVLVKSLPDSGKYQKDNFLISIQFENGSLATIAYMANGNKSASKEYLEVFCAGKTMILDDFRKLHMHLGHRRKTRTLLKQDKGHEAAWDAFIQSIINHSQPPIPYEDLILSTFTTLACDCSQQDGNPVNIAEFMQG